MASIKAASAWANGEVGYVVWEVGEKIKDCLGFMVTRVHETGADAGACRPMPTWVAFRDQSNPNWEEQDSSVWPIQGDHGATSPFAGRVTQPISVQSTFEFTMKSHLLAWRGRDENRSPSPRRLRTKTTKEIHDTKEILGSSFSWTSRPRQTRWT